MNKKSKESAMRETEELLAFDHAIITIYEEILNGERKQFPLYTWELPNSMYYAKVLTQYLLEEKMRWSIEDIKENFKYEIIKKMRLLGMYQTLFSNVYDLIQLVYPNQIKPWELKRVTKNFWDCDDNKKEALKWLFEEKLQWDMEQIKKEISEEPFNKNGLRTLLEEYFNNNLYRTVDFIYPGQINPWELKRVSKEFWDCDDNKKEALRWLFEEKMQWDVEKIKEKADSYVFIRNGLGGLLAHHFNSSPYQAINFLYPGQIQPWELKWSVIHIWDKDENKRKTLEWLVCEKLQWSIEEIDKNLTTKTFITYKLNGLLAQFDGSPYKAMKFLYPNEEFRNLKAKRRSLSKEESVG